MSTYKWKTAWATVLERSHTVSDKTLDLLALSSLVLIYSLFLSLIWNKYFPIQEGWFHFWAILMSQGKIPYVDFHLYLPPLYPLIFYGFYKIFGNIFIIARLFGIVERIALLCTIYLWLRQVFPVRYAVISALASIVVFSSFTTDVLYGYYQSCVLFCVMAGALASRSLAGERRGHDYCMFLSGILAGIAFNIKQSTGLLAPVALVLGITIYLSSRHGLRSASLACLTFGLGFLMPCLMVIEWLAGVGALQGYWSQVFQGTSSKGSLLSVLFGFWDRALKPKYINPFLVVAGIAIVARLRTKATGDPHARVLSVPDEIRRFEMIALLCAIGIWLQQKAQVRIAMIYFFATLVPNTSLMFWSSVFMPRLADALVIVAIIAIAARRWIRPLAKLNAEPISRPNELIFLAITTLLAIMSIVTPYYFDHLFYQIFKLVDGRLVKLTAVHLTFFSLIAMLLISLVKIIHDVRTVRAELWLLIVTSLSITYAHGLSHVLEEHSVVASLALCISTALVLSESARLHLIKLAAYGMCFLIIAMSATQHFAVPYEWWGWQEPDVRLAVVAPPFRELRGFHLSGRTAGVLSRITKLIVDNAQPSEPIYVFPHMPLFYILSHRLPQTYAAVHYFDVCPDWCVQGDAERLRSHPPQVVVYLNLPRHAWIFHEKAFRDGRRSGQRAIQTLVNHWLEEGRYRKVDDIHTGNDFRLWVLVRSPNVSPWHAPGKPQVHPPITATGSSVHRGTWPSV